MRWPTHNVAASKEQLPPPLYTGTFYPDGSRKQGALRVHIGLPQFEVEAAFASADTHEYVPPLAFGRTF
jgi:hypothetical protein